VLCIRARCQEVAQPETRPWVQRPEQTMASTYTPLVVAENEFGHVRSVGVIGAGVAGLQMARACKEYGLEVTVFERAPNVGGLWRENYNGYGVQVPKQFYEFPDFPFQAVKFGDFPTGAQTQQYIEDYAKHFDVLKFVKLKTSVKELKARADGKKGWTFVVQEEGGQEREEGFDFAVVCTGMYSAPKNMPTYEGGDKFDGKVIHSSEYLSQDLAKGKKVVVVGGCKSAIDITVDSSKVAAEPPVQVFRNGHWSTPRLIAGLIPFQYVFLSRLGQALVSWYKGVWPAGGSCCCVLFSWLLFPIMWVAFRLVELIFAIQRCHFGRHWPSLDVVSDFYGFAHVLDTEWVSCRRSGKIVTLKDEIARLEPGKVVLASGKELPAELVVCATGFKKTYDYLPKEAKADLGPEPDGLYLYRHFLPAKVRDLSIAFCGCEVATISNIMTHGLLAEYICRVLKGLVQLPTEEQMRDECEVVKKWKRHWMPETSSRANLVLLHQIHYHDQLLRDLGESPGRKCCFLSELFCPYGPSDYNGIIGTAKDKVVAAQP